MPDRTLAAGDRSLLKGAGARVAAVVAAGSLVLAGGGVAYADAIANRLDTTVDTVAESMTLNLGGSNGTTQLYVVKLPDYGTSGCTINGKGEALTLSLTSSNVGVATVSPASATFTKCEDETTVTVTPLGLGTTNIVAALGSNTTGEPYDVTPVNFDVKVVAPAPSNTAPILSISGVTPGSSYTKGTVPAAVCDVSDKEDGTSSFAAVLSSISGDDAVTGIGTQEASCSYTDAGGLMATSSITYGITDGTAPNISYTLDAAEPDGLDGWYRNAVTLQWTVTEGDSFSTLSKVGCNDVTVMLDQLPANYTCSASSSGGSAGTVTVPIKKDGTAPAVGYADAAGTAGNDNWYTSDVLARFTATDATSGLATSSQQVSSSGEGADVRVLSPAFTDNAGNTVPGGAVYQSFKIDKTAPAVAYDGVASGILGDNDWYVSDVEARFTATDATSGPQTSSQTVFSSGQGPAIQVPSPAFVDNAGNIRRAGATTATFKIDKAAPTVSYVSMSPAANDDGWHNTDVEVTFGATDSVSGPIEATKNVKSSGEGSSVTVESPVFKDFAGNASDAGEAWTTLKIDKTAPTLTIDSEIADGYYGSTAAQPACSASDSLSGLDGSCNVTGYSTKVGKHTLTATATDRAGNTATVTQDYEVKAWTLKGFYQPVDMSGILNTVKGGSTVPAKFEVFAGDVEITDPGVLAFSAAKIQCISGATEDAIETVVTGNTSLRYDATAGQFVYNWKTPAIAGNCYRLTMTAADGGTISANFKLK